MNKPIAMINMGPTKISGGIWQGWGPYIWAGECGSGLDNASGLCYVREDYEDDGIHPAPTGEAKIAARIHARFLQHSWYRK